MIDDSERVDFKQAIRDNGFDLNDFELIEDPDPHGGAEIYPITGQVTIKRKSNGARKSYRAGHGSSWPAEFSDDLNAGVFG